MWRGVGTISLRACGGDSPLIEKSKDIAEPHSEGQTRNLFAAGYEQKPGGVGGWLALFCVTLMFMMNPFVAISMMLLAIARYLFIGACTVFEVVPVPCPWIMRKSSRAKSIRPVLC